MTGVKFCTCKATAPLQSHFSKSNSGNPLMAGLYVLSRPVSQTGGLLDHSSLTLMRVDLEPRLAKPRLATVRRKNARDVCRISDCQLLSGDLEGARPAAQLNIAAIC